MLYEFGACGLDTEKRLLMRDGQPVTLAPKTFDLLVVLVESGGRALSKAYFGSDTAGSLEVYRMPVGGGMATQITRNGGLHAEESLDRKWLYYSKNAEAPSSIWRVPRDGGEETLVIDGLSYSTNFRPTETGIYFISGEHGLDSPAAIEFYDFATAKRRKLITVEKPFTWGLALSPDGQWLTHGTVDHVSSNLMLVENLR